MSLTSDRARLIGFVATSGIRRLFARIGAVFAGGLPFDGRTPGRLLIAPHDLRTSDPTVAGDLYRGRFSLSGSAVEIGGTSPFLLTPPSRAWHEELLGFSWLRHLHASDDAVSRVYARALIADWIVLQGKIGPVGRQPHVMARRIISWLSHSPLYLSNAEPEFYRTVMRSFGRQLRYLARHVHVAPDGVPRLTAHIATVYATLCISGLERLQTRAVRQLARELDRQVLPDGGHFSRDPSAILELLLDLLPLRQTFLSRDVAPPQALLGAIDRMMPMVRFFRHSDGSFGLFNGMGRTAVGGISAVLAYDESRGRPSDQAPHSGYQRIEAGRTVLLMDTGKSPPTSVSHNAHAGCLSIEISSATDRIITNCGTSPILKDEWRQAARATAAHSTVVVADASSCRFITGGPLAAFFGTPIVTGPREVRVSRHSSDDDLVVEARHDGYRRLGLIHHRRIAVAKHGLAIEGQDRLTRSSTLFNRTRPFSIRFHLHPTVEATISPDSRALHLTLASNEVWQFTVFGATLRLEQSVFLADPKGAQRTSQIVISGKCSNEALIRWTLRRGPGGQAPRVRALRDGEREEQILPQTVDPTATTTSTPAPPNEPTPSNEPPNDTGPAEPADDIDAPTAADTAPTDQPTSARQKRPDKTRHREPTLGDAPDGPARQSTKPVDDIERTEPRFTDPPQSASDRPEEPNQDDEPGDIDETKNPESN